MDNLTKPNPESAETAEAAENIAAADLGKFKDVKALMDAYTGLEAEFTRRSQRLRELENANKEKNPPEKAAPSQERDIIDDRQLLEAAMQSEEVKNAVIGDYLARASANKSVPLVTGGVNVYAAHRAPATVKDAGRLAQQFLNKREN